MRAISLFTSPYHLDTKCRIANSRHYSLDRETLQLRVQSLPFQYLTGIQFSNGFIHSFVRVDDFYWFISIRRVETQSIRDVAAQKASICKYTDKLGSFGKKHHLQF